MYPLHSFFYALEFQAYNHNRSITIVKKKNTSFTINRKNLIIMFRNALLLFVLLQSILKALFIFYLISLKTMHGNYCQQYF